MAANPRYRATGLHRLFLGPNYRRLWATPIEVEVLDVDLDKADEDQRQAIERRPRAPRSQIQGKKRPVTGRLPRAPGWNTTVRSRDDRPEMRTAV